MGGVACNFGLTVYIFKLLFQAHKVCAWLLCSSACAVKESKHKKRGLVLIILIIYVRTLVRHWRAYTEGKACTKCLLETKEFNKQTA